MASANNVVNKLREQARKLIDSRGDWEKVRIEFQAHGKQGLVDAYEQAKAEEGQAGSPALTGIPSAEEVLQAIQQLDQYLVFLDSEEMKILIRIAS